jgi:hypothetical protein
MYGLEGVKKLVDALTGNSCVAVGFDNAPFDLTVHGARCARMYLQEHAFS